MGSGTSDISGDEAASVGVRPSLERALEGQPVTFETELPHRDGSARVVRATYTPQRDPDGRGTRQRRGPSQGLGLGLFIVKELVRAHGGTVDVASSEAHGTTFAIRLPRRPPPA